MTAPVADSYSCSSGGMIAGGRFNAPETIALIGDSLTDKAYGLTSFFWLNGLNGGKLSLIANAGISGDTVGDVLLRVDSSYTSSPPGLAGLGPLGYAMVRIGTNSARAGSTIASLAATYTSLLNKIAGYASRVIILAVPPLGGPEASGNSKVIDYNAWLSAFAAAHPGNFTFIDDCAGLRDGSNAQIASYFIADGVHFNSAGVVKCGIDAAAQFGALISAGRPSPVSTNPANVYPSTPQWVVNPMMAGTGGSASGGFTGSVSNNWSVSAYGAGFSGSCSKVAADAGDPNQTPWQRITPSAGPSPTMGESISITTAMAGRAITPADPTQLDVVIELRLNALDSNKIGSVLLWMQGSGTGEKVFPDLSLRLGGGLLSQTVVLRHKMPREAFATHAGATLYLYISPTTSFSGDVGSIDFRCVTVRG